MNQVSKAVILAGGYGTRIYEESIDKPKPLILIGDKPILWHIMKYFSYFNINEFIICCGYKGHMIKEFFYNYSLHNSDITIDFVNNKKVIHSKPSEPWKITLVDTGLDTMTAGRLKQVSKYIDKDETFFFTYGDGLTDINLNELQNFHFKQNVYATVSAINPPSRWGNIDISNNKVVKFSEKPENSDSYINCGFFLLHKKVLNYIDGDKIFWEKEPMQNLAKNNQLAAFKHNGFFGPMDNLRDKMNLENLVNKNKAPWMLWR